MAPDPEGQDDFARAVDPVADWAGSVSGLPVVHDWNDAPDAGGAALLRPLSIEVAPQAGPARTHITSAELTLGLLVTVIGLPVREAASATSALALAAVADSEWRMDAGGPDTALWNALGHAPAPAFLLRVPVRRLLERPSAPPVREPLRVVPAHLRTVVGRIVTADGLPVPAASVRLADGQGRAVPADRRGRFRLPVATSGAPLALRVDARGTSTVVEIPPAGIDASGDLGDLALSTLHSV